MFECKRKFVPILVEAEEIQSLSHTQKNYSILNTLLNTIIWYMVTDVRLVWRTNYPNSFGFLQQVLLHSLLNKRLLSGVHLTWPTRSLFSYSEISIKPLTWVNNPKCLESFLWHEECYWENCILILKFQTNLERIVVLVVQVQPWCLGHIYCTM